MFQHSSTFKQWITNVLIVGAGGYASITVFYWLLMWLMVSVSYCNSARYHQFEAYRHACGLPLYPKWEYLSTRHAEEFRRSLQTLSQNGCPGEVNPVRVKVMHYKQDQALVWYEGESGSRWLVRFLRDPRTNSWTLFDQERQICQIDIIFSTMGGSADDIFWY